MYVIGPKVKLPLTEGKIREIMKPVCRANATYRKLTDDAMDGTGITSGDYNSPPFTLFYRLNTRRLCAGVDLRHPVFSPEQAMAVFKKLFGSLVSFTTPISVKEWRFNEEIILRQYNEYKYGYVVEVCGFYAVIFIGDRYCYICEKFKGIYNTPKDISKNRKELSVYLSFADYDDFEFGCINKSVCLTISPKDYTVKKIALGTYETYYGFSAKKSKTYENHPSQEEYEADIRKYCKEGNDTVTTIAFDRSDAMFMGLKIVPTRYKQKPDIIIRADIDDVR